MKPKILICDPVDEKVKRILRKTGEIVVPPDGSLMDELLSSADALLVRSRTKVTADVLSRASSLKAIGRVGIGIDNIDVEEATRKGIIVVNSPSGNTFSVAQHTIALILAHYSNIIFGDRTVKQGRWQKNLLGKEIKEKALGIIGLGKIGSEVARLAKGLGMHVIAHDPYVARSRAKQLGVQLISLEELLRSSDVVSIHVPLSDATRNLIGTKELTLMKSSAFLINTSRGGIIDEEAFLDALENGRIAGAGLDVFSQEPPENEILRSLVTHERIIATPHIAGSTKEAQVKAGEEVALDVVAVLEGRIPKNAVNYPYQAQAGSEIILPFIEVAEALGDLARQLLSERIEKMTCVFYGPIAHHDTRILKAAGLKGLLRGVTTEFVNVVNALAVAQQYGISIVEELKPQLEQSSLSITVGKDADAISLEGKIDHEGVKLTAIRSYPVHIKKSESYLLFVEQQDQPGVVGRLGTILGNANINIAQMQVARKAPRKEAITILVLDDPVPSEILQTISGLPNIKSVKLAKF